MVNNRRAGHNLEREIAEEWRQMGFTSCTTSRYSSREMDDQCVDLCGTDPFYVQTKRYKSAPSYHAVLRDMPKDSDHYNVIIHRRPNQGDVAVMDKKTFYAMVYLLKQANVL